MGVVVIIIIILVTICLCYMLLQHGINKLYGSGLYTPSMLINGKNNVDMSPLITPEEGKFLQSPPKPDDFNKVVVNTLLSEISTLYDNKLEFQMRNNIHIPYYKNYTNFADGDNQPAFKMSDYVGNASHFEPDLTLYTFMLGNAIIYIEYDEKNDFHSNMNDKSYKAKLLTYNNLIIRHGKYYNGDMKNDTPEMDINGVPNPDPNIHPVNIIVLRITYPSNINSTDFDNSAEHIKFGVLSCISHFISQMFQHTFGKQTPLRNILLDGGYVLYQLPRHCVGGYIINWCPVYRMELINTTQNNTPMRLIDMFNNSQYKDIIKKQDILTLYYNIYINVFQTMFRPEWTNMKDVKTPEDFLKQVYLPN